VAASRVAVSGFALSEERSSFTRGRSKLPSKERKHDGKWADIGIKKEKTGFSSGPRREDSVVGRAITYSLRPSGVRCRPAGRPVLDPPGRHKLGDIIIDALIRQSGRVIWNGKSFFPKTSRQPRPRQNFSRLNPVPPGLKGTARQLTRLNEEWAAGKAGGTGGGLEGMAMRGCMHACMHAFCLCRFCLSGLNLGYKDDDRRPHQGTYQ